MPWRYRCGFLTLQYRFNRPGVEFYVVSSDQGRPQSRPRRSRSAVAPPSSSRRAVPRYICRRCVAHALTRVKLFLDRTWASLVQLQRTGPWPRSISRHPVVCEGIDTGDLFHDVFTGEGILFHPRFVRNLDKRYPIKHVGEPCVGGDRPAHDSPHPGLTGGFP